MCRVDQGLAVKAQGKALFGLNTKPIEIAEIIAHPVEREQPARPRRRKREGQDRQHVGAVRHRPAAHFKRKIVGAHHKARQPRGGRGIRDGLQPADRQTGLDHHPQLQSRLRGGQRGVIARDILRPVHFGREHGINIERCCCR